MLYSRVIEEHMELCFFTVGCGFRTSSGSGAYEPQEFMCSRFDSLQVGQIEVQKDGFVARLLFELADRVSRLRSVSCGDVDSCAAGEENLSIRRRSKQPMTIRTGDVPWRSPSRCRWLAPVTMMTLPVRSGTSCTRKVGLEGKASLNMHS